MTDKPANGSQNPTSPARTLLTWLAAFAFLLASGIFSALLYWPAITEVASSLSPEYPDLQDETLPHPPSLVLRRAAETVALMDGWQLEHSDLSTRHLRAHVVLPLMGCRYSVDIYVDPLDGGSLLHLRSQSAGGRGDFGQNARNLRRFQRELRANLELARRID